MKKHKHHIIPKHMGGDNNPLNLINVSIPMHAALHKDLFKHLHKIEDFIAWKCLEGKSEECEIQRIELSKQGFEKFKNSPKFQIFKDNISKSLSGKKLSNSHKMSISLGNKLAYKTGKRTTNEIKALGNSHKGKTLSLEHKEKLCLARSQRKTSKQTRSKLSNSLTGRTFNEDSINKIKQSTKGIPKGKKKIYVNGEIFESIKSASDFLGLTWGILSRQCKSKKYPNTYFIESK